VLGLNPYLNVVDVEKKAKQRPLISFKGNTGAKNAFIRRTMLGTLDPSTILRRDMTHVVVALYTGNG
jgi:hypothetical protein